MNLFTWFLEFIKDKSTSWSAKVTLFISIVALISMVDYSFDFSLNYHLNSKIEQLEKLDRLKSSYIKCNQDVSNIENLESVIISKSHYSILLSRFFLQSSNSEITDDKKPTDTITNKPTITNTIFDPYWMIFSSNYTLIIIYPFMLFMPLYNKDRSTNMILGWFSMLIIIAILISIVTWVSYQIPLIMNNPRYNYWTNFIIHTAFITILGAMASNNKTKR